MGIFTENLNFGIIAIATTTLVLTITYLKWKLKYWDRVGLPSLNPTILFGNTKELIMGKKNFGEQFQDFYEQIKGKGLKHSGIYFGLEPWYVPIDPEIIKHIMQIDFSHFVDHGNYIDEEIDPLSGHLFNLRGSKWRNMRVKLTPTFTSGKMKMMFHTLVDCSEGLKDIMENAAKSKTALEIKDVLGRFTTDVIGSVAFGIECNSLKNPDSLFRKYGKRIFENTTMEKLKGIITFIVPHRLLKMISFKLTKDDVEDFIMNTVKKTVTYREKNNVYRKDFMHLLLQLKNRGAVTDDEKITDEENKTGEKALTINELAAQAFIFFGAGFETSSTTMTFALYELATHQNIQDKLREEINTVLAKYDDKITYDGIMEMTYLDKVISETLRKYPPAPLTNRLCSKDYTIPHTNIVLKKGVQVGISILGVQRDPEYYPDPDLFDPERFSEEAKKSRPPFTYYPFGEGPRACIGMRFGLMQAKVGLTALLRNFRVSLNKKTKLPITMEKNDFILSVQGGVWLNVEKLA